MEVIGNEIQRLIAWVRNLSRFHTAVNSGHRKTDIRACWKMFTLRHRQRLNAMRHNIVREPSADELPVSVDSDLIKQRS